MSVISIAVPINITMQFNKGIYLPYTVTNPFTTNILAIKLIIGEKYIPSTYYIYTTLIQHSTLKRFIFSNSW